MYQVIASARQRAELNLVRGECHDCCRQLINLSFLSLAALAVADLFLGDGSDEDRVGNRNAKLAIHTQSGPCRQLLAVKSHPLHHLKAFQEFCIEVPAAESFIFH